MRYYYTSHLSDNLNSSSVRTMTNPRASLAEPSLLNLRVRGEARQIDVLFSSACWESVQLGLATLQMTCGTPSELVIQFVVKAQANQYIPQSIAYKTRPTMGCRLCQNYFLLTLSRERIFTDLRWKFSKFPSFPSVQLPCGYLLNALSVDSQQGILSRSPPFHRFTINSNLSIDSRHGH